MCLQLVPRRRSSVDRSPFLQFCAANKTESNKKGRPNTTHKSRCFSVWVNHRCRRSVVQALKNVLKAAYWQTNKYTCITCIWYFITVFCSNALLNDEMNVFTISLNVGESQWKTHYCYFYCYFTVSQIGTYHFVSVRMHSVPLLWM